MKILIAILCFVSLSAFAQTVKNVAVLKYSAQSTREDGSPFLQSDIGGYEIKYKRTADSEFKTLLIADPLKTTYELELPAFDQYDILIAVYDKNFIYSAPKEIKYNIKHIPPRAVNATVDQKVLDPSLKCTLDVSCKVIK